MKQRTAIRLSLAFGVAALASAATHVRASAPPHLVLLNTDVVGVRTNVEERRAVLAFEHVMPRLQQCAPLIEQDDRVTFQLEIDVNARGVMVDTVGASFQPINPFGDLAEQWDRFTPCANQAVRAASFPRAHAPYQITARIALVHSAP